MEKDKKAQGESRELLRVGKRRRNQYITRHSQKAVTYGLEYCLKQTQRAQVMTKVTGNTKALGPNGRGVEVDKRWQNLLCYYFHYCDAIAVRS